MIVYAKRAPIAVLDGRQFQAESQPSQGYARSQVQTKIFREDELNAWLFIAVRDVHDDVDGWLGNYNEFRPTRRWACQ